jgi:hypothetical protein
MQSKTVLAIAAFASLGTLARAQDKSSEKDILTIYKGAHSYKEVSVGGRTTEIYVDDKQVAQNEMPHYDSLILVMRTDVDEENRDRAREDAQEVREEAQAERDREQGQRDREQGQSDREQGQRDREQGQQDREQGQRNREQGQLNREQGQRDREQGQRDRQRAREDRTRMQEIVRFLVDKKIVPDQAHLDGLVLTDSALYVNDIKQPTAIHQALKEKYSDWARYGITYGNACASGVNIHISLPGDCCQ